MGTMSMVIAAGTAALIAPSAFAQVTITSSLRTVEARYHYSDGSDMPDNQYELFESDQLGIFDRIASTGDEATASMTSDVDLTGLIEGSASVEQATIRKGKGFVEQVSARSEMIVEFTVDAATPYSLDIVSIGANGSENKNDFLFELSRQGLPIVYLDGDDWMGSSASLSQRYDGILNPGFYTLNVFAQPVQDFAGSGVYNSYPVSFDFTLTIPGPSTLAILVAPVGLLGLRRRR